MSGPDAWGAVLAELLLRGTADLTDDHLKALAAAGAGTETHDPTRQALMRLLSARLAQTTAHPARPADPAPLPAWPGDVPSPLPPFHGAGLQGTSLVTICHDDADALTTSLPIWATLPVDEIVVVDWSTTPLRPPDDTRVAHLLRIVRLEGAGLSAAQALNVAIRLSRYQRVLALAPTLQLAATYLSGTAPAAGAFRVDPGSADGNGYALDVDRRDLALVGGFNEFLDTADYGVDELVTRLNALGLRPVPFSRGQISRPPFPASAGLDQGDLGSALRASPQFAAHRNRHLAAVMPDWTAERSRAFGLSDRSGSALTLHPLAPLPKPPASLMAEAERHALVDLISLHIGGTPTALEADGLNLLLGAPAADVCKLDIAVAASNQPKLVRSRRAWLIIHIDAAALPRDGSTALAVFQSVESRAALHGMTIVLTLPNGALASDLPALSRYPVILHDPEVTRGIRALTLRDLQADPADWMLPHCTLDFNAQTVADHDTLTRCGPAILLRRPRFFVDAQHGLGNRLRTIASAGAIALETGRELVIIWQPDDHCDCRYDDLFEPGGAVLNQGFHDDPTIRGIDFFNYMEIEPGSAKDQPITLSSFRDTYVRSAYPLNSPFSNWDKENSWLAGLRPNPVVLDLVASVRNPNALSMHIRMEGGVAVEHLAYESSANWTAAAHLEIDHWRKRSHFHYFEARLDQLIDEGLADTVFLATDTPAVYASFRDRYGDRIAYLPRPATDRSAPALVYALADMLLLSRAPHLLGSTWSSFSELAARLGDPMLVELSGRDF